MTGKKIKEPITLRYQLLKNGCKSLYLDYYNSGQRKYEFLKMYLVPETDKETKLLNKSVLKAANAIKLKRNQQVLFERSGLKQEPCNISLLEWLKECMANAMQQAKSKGRKEYSCYRNYNSMQKVVAKFLKSAYKRNDITLEEVNKEFCLKFIHYLDTCTNKWGQPFAQGSKNKYLSKFSSALQRAVRKGYIASNPTSLLDPDERIATAKTQREYLSEEELSRLVKTDCPNAKVKQAFLFSCLCGLRWSDIITLEWGHVFLNEKTHRIEKPVYPLIAEGTVTESPDAATYYTKVAATPNRIGNMHSSNIPIWQIAVNEERRKEFNCEWSLCPDMVKSGYIEEHINYNYPVDNTAGDALRDYPWSHRVYTYDPLKMDMPIPAVELLKNTDLKQNPAYAGK